MEDKVIEIKIFFYLLNIGIRKHAPILSSCEQLFFSVGRTEQGTGSWYDLPGAYMHPSVTSCFCYESFLTLKTKQNKRTHSSAVHFVLKKLEACTLILSGKKSCLQIWINNSTQHKCWTCNCRLWKENCHVWQGPPAVKLILHNCTDFIQL